jgi:hypothetical protein
MMIPVPTMHRVAIVMVALPFDPLVIAMFPRPALALVVPVSLVPLNLLVTFPLLMAIMIIRCRAHRRAQCQRQNHRR